MRACHSSLPSCHALSRRLTFALSLSCFVILFSQFLSSRLHTFSLTDTCPNMLVEGDKGKQKASYQYLNEDIINGLVNMWKFHPQKMAILVQMSSVWWERSFTMISTSSTGRINNLYFCTFYPALFWLKSKHFRCNFFYFHFVLNSHNSVTLYNFLSFVNISYRTNNEQCIFTAFINLC